MAAVFTTQALAPCLRRTPSMGMNVGFIGLGIMGSRMAANLRAHGYDLIVFNRTRDSAEPLLRAGAKWGSSPTVVARQVDLLFTMLPTPDAVRASALDADGFLHGLRRKTIHQVGMYHNARVGKVLIDTGHLGHGNAFLYQLQQTVRSAVG